MKEISKMKANRCDFDWRGAEVIIYWMGKAIRVEENKG